MVETRRYDEASKYYSEVVDYYLKECGIYPSASLMEILERYSNQMNHTLIYEEGTLQRATVEALLAEGFRLIAVPFRPTAEQFSKCFYEKLSSDGLPVRRVAVYETPENCAVYEV